MMEELGFLRALADNPADDSTLLVHAGWCEERGDAVRAEFLRLTATLGRGAIEPQQLHPTIRHLAKLRRALDAAWLDKLIQARAAGPLRLRILEVFLIGEVEPREMFNWAKTFVHGFLESGMVRVGQEVAIPLENGCSLIKRVSHLHCFPDKDFEQLSAGQEPLEFVLMWPGHWRDIQQYGVIIAEDSGDPNRRRQC